MRNQRRRPKYYYYNRKVLGWLFLGGSLFGAAVCGIGSFASYNTWEQYGGGPTEIAAAELMDQGPGKSRFVHLTGIQTGPEFWMAGGKQNDRRDCWLVAAPEDDPSLDRPKNVPPARVIVLYLRDDDAEKRIAEIERTHEFTGKLAVGNPTMDLTARQFFRRRYPGSDIEQAWVVSEYSTPQLAEVWAFAAVSILSGIASSAAMIYLFLLRRAQRGERPKPPPLPWEHPR
jgi:hypothetical protein